MAEDRRALAYVMKILAGRDHSEAELRRKLALKGFPDMAADSVVDKLRDSGYVDDERFALAWAESAIRNGRGYGYRLKADLLRRGVAEDVITRTLQRLGDEHDENAVLADLMARKFAGFDSVHADDRQKRRVIGYFQRRGFTLAAILKMLRATEE